MLFFLGPLQNAHFHKPALSVQGNAQAPGYRGHAAKFKQQLNIKLEKL